MVSEYKKICKNFKCKAKVFTQMTSSMKMMIGQPDLMIVFTNTVSHKMVKCALNEAERNKYDTIRCHSSSSSALKEILKKKILENQSNCVDAY